jgi:chaperone modulatory protein CbpM
MTHRSTTVTSRVTVAHCTVVDAADPLAAAELAHACGASLEWVAELTEIGVFSPRTSSRMEDWRFDSADLRLALEARRLQRDYGIDLDAAALILDLQREVRRLRSLLGAP